MAVLGASNPDLCRGDLDADAAGLDWLGTCACSVSGAATPRLLVPDNLKSAIHKASFYDPEVNRSYGAMATHYLASASCPPGRGARATRRLSKPGCGSRSPTFLVGCAT